MARQNGQLDLFPTETLLPGRGQLEQWQPFHPWTPVCIFRYVYGRHIPGPWSGYTGCYVIFEFPLFSPIYYVGKTWQEGGFGARFKGHYANPKWREQYGTGTGCSAALFDHIESLPPRIREDRLGLALFLYRRRSIIASTEEEMKLHLRPRWNRH